MSVRDDSFPGESGGDTCDEPLLSIGSRWLSISGCSDDFVMCASGVAWCCARLAVSSVNLVMSCGVGGALRLGFDGGDGASSAGCCTCPDGVEEMFCGI